MSLVMNEYEWTEHMIGNRDLGKKPTETLSRVAKYYYTNQYSKREIRRILDEFVIQCDPAASLPGWSDTLDKIAGRADKYPIIKIDSIGVSSKELERIETLEGRQIRRLAFTLLCVAKYWDTVSARNNHWVNTPDREIMQMANIQTSVRRQSMMFAELKEAGMIQFSKKIDNLNVRVVFMDDGAAVLHIQDFRNLGYQYLKYYGAPYFECGNCGITVKIQEHAKGRRQKYCPGCAAEIKTRQSVNSVMRRRNTLRSQAKN